MRCDVPVALIEPVVANQGLSTRLQKLRSDVEPHSLVVGVEVVSFQTLLVVFDTRKKETA